MTVTLCGVGETAIQRDARRRAEAVRRSVAEGLRRLREDAGLTQAAVARAAGIDPSHLTLLEAGRRDGSYEVLATVAAVLGADLSVRLFPNTGARIHDRIQAPMVECLLRELHARWARPVEVVVSKPARGVIDVVLGDRDERLLVASEVQSRLRRLEQQVRWHREKELSLPSSELWPFAAADGTPRTSRLLVLRSTRELHDLARAFPGTLESAYPARTVDVIESLTGTRRWPGAGIIWIRVHGQEVRLLDGPPRGVALGR